MTHERPEWVSFDENPEGWRCVDSDVRGERSALVFGVLIALGVALVVWFAR